MAFAPDGRMFIAEKAGRVRVVSAAGVLLPDPVVDISSRVNTYWDRGLLSIAVDSDFAGNGYLYLFYVHESNPLDSTGPKTSRLTRVTMRADNTVENPASPETVILGAVTTPPCPASNTSDCIPADACCHAIGGVRSDSDGTLWVGVGDGASPASADTRSLRAYNEQSYSGKLLHVDRQGRGLPGHPFCPADADLTHVCTKVHSRGLRYPYRVTLRPGRPPLVGDVGWRTMEEMDAARAGANYGWPCYEGSSRTPAWRDRSECAAEYAKEGTASAAVPPVYEYAHTSSAPNAAIVQGPVYNGTQYPAEYQGDVFVADYSRRTITRLELDSGDRLLGAQTFGTGWVEGVALEGAPDGDLVWVNYAGGGAGAGTVGRISFTGTSGNRPPLAVASGSPTSGDPPLIVQFRGSDSSDPDGDRLTYRWDFGNTHGDTRPDPVVRYDEPGTYVAELTVGDGRGGSDTDTVTITVGGGGNQPPSATISQPADGSLYRLGQPVTLAGSGSDPEDGTLGDAALSWRVILRHADHIHDYGSFPGASASFTPAPDHDSDSFFEVELTATDSGGMRDTETVTIRPQTVPFTLASSPSGAPLSYAGAAVTAPFSKQSSIGFRTTISAADQFTRDGTTYRFVRWSDGGARAHDITIPDTASTLTATYEPVSGGNQTPAASFDFSPAAPVAGQSVTFTSTSTDPDGTVVRQLWDLDGDTHFQNASGPTASWTFPAPGTYTVSLYVEDDRGASSVASRTVTVTSGSSGNKPPIADFTWSPASPAPGETVDFTSTSSDPDGTIVRQLWDLDDDTHFQNASGPTASRSFSAAGQYTVSLYVRDDAGASSIVSRTVQVGGAGGSGSAFASTPRVWLSAAAPPRRARPASLPRSGPR